MPQKLALAESVSEALMMVTVVLKSWEMTISRATKLFDSLDDDQMLTPLAPGKNRPMYLLGHLLTVNDAMIGQMRLGQPDHANLKAPFLTEPDGAVIEIPSISELHQYWTASNKRLSELFHKLTPEQWLERHSSISEEEFALEPHRNRLAILLSRTGHISYHVGQIVLFHPSTSR